MQWLYVTICIVSPYNTQSHWIVEHLEIVFCSSFARIDMFPMKYTPIWAFNRESFWQLFRAERSFFSISFPYSLFARCFSLMCYWWLDMVGFGAFAAQNVTTRGTTGFSSERQITFNSVICKNVHLSFFLSLFQLYPSLSYVFFSLSQLRPLFYMQFTSIYFEMQSNIRTAHTYTPFNTDCCVTTRRIKMNSWKDSE